MALWDALTGKIFRFNKMKDEANHQVCTALRTFISSRLPEYPTGERFFLQGRNALYAFYLGANGFLSDHIDGTLAKYKQAISSLSVHNYLCLVSALHMGHVVSAYLWERDNEGNDSAAARSWFLLLTEGVCEIYGRPYSYGAEGVNRLQWLAESPEHTAMRLTFRIYDEIAPILGLPQNDPIECLNWDLVRVQCAGRMRALHDRPDWGKLVDAEVAAH